MNDSLSVESLLKRDRIVVLAALAVQNVLDGAIEVLTGLPGRSSG